jgi:hypothetical protein
MPKLALAATFAIAVLTSFSAAPTQAQVQLDTPCGDAICPAGGSSSPSSCGDELGHLSRVFPADVTGIDNGYRVWVTELCPGASLMRSDGNAAYLRPSIAQNDLLVAMLGEKGYHADDVFAVRMMGDDTISLYVHHFDR